VHQKNDVKAQPLPKEVGRRADTLNGKECTFHFSFKGQFMNLNLRSLVPVRSLALTTCLCLAGNAYAVNLDLSLTVSGSRLPAPQWQNGSSAAITTLDFGFSGIVGPAAADVDSATVQTKLVNAASYPATVAVTVPGTCSIGATTVAPADVKVLFNGSTAGSTISLSSNALQNLGIRFAGSGNYGDKAGTVACSAPGQLRYSY
jgi:hypothetical protein